MYHVIVESTRELTHHADASWKSPEWARVWKHPSKVKAARRAKELRHNPNWVVIVLRVLKKGVEVVDV